jgi:hypothetical protein
MASLQDPYNDPNLMAAQQQAQAATTQATAYQSAASLLPQKLREAIMSKLDYNKDLIESQNKAMSEYFQAPSAAREKYQDVWNPFQRENLVAQERAMAYQPYANLTDLLGQRMGSVSDMIQSGTGAFNSAVTAQQGAAQLAAQNYQDLFQRAGALSDAAYKDAQLAKSSGGSGATGMQSFLDGLMATMALLQQGGQTASGPTEEKPTVKPEGSSWSQNVSEWRSPQGQWKYDPAIKDWKPYTENELFGGAPTAQSAPAPEPWNWGNTVKLQDPSTGEVYEYDGYEDPDYISDLGRGFSFVE